MNKTDMCVLAEKLLKMLTKSRLDKTDPRTEACTTSILPSLRAKMAKINSTALPNDAFSRAPRF